MADPNFKRNVGWYEAPSIYNYLRASPNLNMPLSVKFI